MRDAEASLIPAMRAYGLGLLPYFPLASGLLTGKCRRDMPMPEGARLTRTPRLAERCLTQNSWEPSEKLADLAEARGRKPVELAFAWLLAQAPVARS